MQRSRHASPDSRWISLSPLFTPFTVRWFPSKSPLWRRSTFQSAQFVLFLFLSPSCVHPLCVYEFRLSFFRHLICFFCTFLPLPASMDCGWFFFMHSTVLFLSPSSPLSRSIHFVRPKSLRSLCLFVPLPLQVLKIFKAPEFPSD